MNARNTNIRTRLLRLGAIVAFTAVAAGSAGEASAGDVDGRDFLTWQRGTYLTQSATDADLAVWQSNYGASSAASGDYDVWQSNFGRTK